MELFTETNGQILSLIINIIVILIFNNKYMKDVSIIYYGYMILSALDVFVNTIMLGYTFKLIHQFIYFLSRFSLSNLLLMIADIFIIGIFIITYMILMVYNVKFIQSFYKDYSDGE